MKKKQRILCIGIITTLLILFGGCSLPGPEASGFTVSYHANGADSGDVPDTQKKIEGLDLKLAANSGSLGKRGFFFTGWNTAVNGRGEYYVAGGLYSIDADVILYAEWSISEYKIIYNLDGGTNHADNPDSYSIEDGSIILKSPVRNYHHFGGWYSDGGLVNMVTEIPAGSSGTISLYAKWNNETIFHAEDMSNTNYLGTSMSVSGNMMVIGAYMTPGPLENYAYRGGAAFIFTDDGAGNWSETEILYSSDRQASDFFGMAVDIDGDYIIIGAPYEDGGTVGSYENSGAAYIFRYDEAGDSWTEVAILHADDIQPSDFFGWSVSISGNYAIVGAHYENGGDGDAYTYAGEAYIFKNDGHDNWTQVESMHSPILKAGAQFGHAVSIDGDYTVVGSMAENRGTSGEFSSAGAAYIYHNDGSDNWNLLQDLESPNLWNGCNFGSAVIIDGDYIAIGASGENAGTGTAYVYKKTGANWVLEESLLASDRQVNDRFGNAVSMSGDYIIVGATGEDGGDGDTVTGAGAAYVYRKDGDENWSETARLRAGVLQEDDYYGRSVAVDGSFAFVGADWENGGDGDPAGRTGAVYMYYIE